MTGETQNKPRGAANSVRPGYDRNRRGRGNVNRGDTRGARGRGGEFRGANRRGSDVYVTGYEGRGNASAAYVPQRQYYSKDDNENYRTNVHVTKFDGNTLSDLNEFPDFNQFENSTGSAKNYRKTDTRGSENSGEVKSLNWNGRDQSAHFAHRGVDNPHSDQRNYSRVSSNESQRMDDRVFDHFQIRPSRGSGISPGQGRGNGNGGRQYPRRTFDNNRRANTRPSNFVENSPPQNFEEPRYAPPTIDLSTLFSNSRFVSPPSMEGYESMPGDTSHDHEESNFYKVKVNDDTLDPTLRVIHQLEFYFSNFNLKTDSFLRDHMDRNGYVAFDTILTFPRMMRLKTIKQNLVDAVNASDKLECDVCIEMVRRVDTPLKWTNYGLYSECARIYNSYIYDVNFLHWYAKAQEYMKGFPTDTQPSVYYPEMPMNLPMVPMAFDPKTGQMLPPVVFPYSPYMGGWPPMEFMGQPEVDMSQYPMINFEADPAPFPVEQERNKSPEPYDPMANEMFKEMVSARAVNEEVEDGQYVSVTDSLHAAEGNNQETNAGASQAHPEEMGLAGRKILSDGDNFMMNPKELRKFQLASKVKPQPVKYDRHSASVQYKNVKSEAHRDTKKQVDLGIKSYEHEEHKISTSVHGSLSQNPEASSKVFVADVTRQTEKPKTSKPNLPTVVDGTRIVTDKKIIEQACAKFKEGVQEPIPIERYPQTHPAINGVKDATDGKSIRRDNKRPSGAKGKKGSGGGPPMKGPTN